MSNQTTIAPEIEREAARVAAAFEIEEWEWHPEFRRVAHIFREDYSFYFQFDEVGKCIVFSIGENETFSDECEVRLRGFGATIYWYCTDANNSVFNEQMARGLYRLGFDDPAILAQLPELSAHEKLELRLSLPREFWPQKWLDEVAQNPNGNVLTVRR